MVSGTFYISFFAHERGTRKEVNDGDKSWEGTLPRRELVTLEECVRMMNE